MNFRTLRADEIECRVSTVKKNGCSLLLYKDARCDMNVLDESFGIFGWQRKHELIDGQLFCSVGIFDDLKGVWIWKQDVGTESYTEKEKGRASDSFKRACFNIGIGRELYTAPFIWIPSSKCEIVPKGDGYTTYDRFEVAEIGYDENRRINKLLITRKGEPVFGINENPQVATEKISNVKAKALRKRLEDAGIPLEQIYTLYHVESLDDLDERKHAHIHAHWQNILALKDGKQG